VFFVLTEVATDRRERIGCPRAINCLCCQQLGKKYGKKLNLAILSLGPKASASEIEAFIIQGHPNPENS
jgi:hypothetical protein